MANQRTSRLLIYRLLLAGVSLLIALILVELACRVIIPPESTIRFQQDVDELEGLDLNEAAGMIENDPELFWKLAPSTKLPDESWPFFGIVSNAQSLREDGKIPVDKPQGQTRVLFLGDSCTFGYGVDQKQTYVEVAETMLEERLGSSVECINAGVPGYTVFQGYRYLVAKGLDLQPDLVVLNFGWNDSGVWDHLGDREHHAILKAMRPPGLLEKSRLCQIMWRYWKKPDVSQSTKEKRPRILPGEFAETMGEIHDLLAERDISLLVLVWPMRANSDPSFPPDARTPLQVEMGKFGQTHPLSAKPPINGALDLVPLSQKLVSDHGVNAIYLDHGHVTPFAHMAFAEAVVDHISPWLAR